VPEKDLEMDPQQVNVPIKDKEDDVPKRMHKARASLDRALLAAKEINKEKYELNTNT
jgi:hypothetical protein